MFEKLQKLNMELVESKQELFSKYINLFLEYNSKVNLISKNDEKVLFEKHIFDSFAINLFFKRFSINNNIKLLDIGTGGGFPSLPIALCFENINVYALDSIAKKINFIKYAKEELKIENIHPICSRVEELPIENKNAFDVVTSRAMAELRLILEYALPYVKENGYFVAYKSLKAEDEIKNAQNALKVLNGKIIEKIEYSLPLEEENKRVLLIIQKTKRTPNQYPRQNGIVKKKPL